MLRCIVETTVAVVVGSGNISVADAETLVDEVTRDPI